VEKHNLPDERTSLVALQKHKRMENYVFISYSSQDSEIAQTVCQGLEKRGIRCWIASRDILPGQDWATAIINAINDCKTLILIYTENSNHSTQVHKEIERADNKGKRIITYRFDGYQSPFSKPLEYFLSHRHYLNANTFNIEKGLPELASSIRTSFRLELNTQRSINDHLRVETLNSDSKQISSSDKEIIRNFYSSFDRPAFRIPFVDEADLDTLIEAIDDTIATINTGVKKRRDGIVFGTATEGKSSIVDRNIRKKFDEIVDLLSQVKTLFVQAEAAGWFWRDSPPTSKAFNLAHRANAIKLAVTIDEIRNKVITIANNVFTEMGLEPFPPIRASEHYLFLDYQLQERRRSWWKFWRRKRIVHP
jgi:hypothetical protein